MVLLAHLPQEFVLLRSCAGPRGSIGPEGVERTEGGSGRGDD